MISRMPYDSDRVTIMDEAGNELFVDRVTREDCGVTVHCIGEAEPEEIKELKEDVEKSERECDGLMADNEELQDSVNRKMSRIETLETEVANLKGKLARQ